MINSKKISLVIPCYNEAAGLSRLFQNDLSLLDEIIVVDNNCTDQTAKIAENFGCRVITEKIKGYGAAYKAGLKSVTGDIVVTMDGDNTYPVREISRLVKNLLEKDFDFISASRLGNGRPSSMSKINYLGNLVLTGTLRLLYGKVIEDSQSGMWVFKKEVLKKIRPESDGMAFSQEIKIEALKNSFKFAEIRIPYNQRLGQEKLNRWSDGARNLAWLFYKRFF